MASSMKESIMIDDESILNPSCDKTALDRTVTTAPTYVRYALYFPWSINAMDVEGISKKWLSYPTVTQLAPVDLPDSYDIFGGDPWPLGLTVFESGLYGERILFQSDRLAVEWNAEVTDQSYPGYSQMKAILVERHNEFIEVLAGNGVKEVANITSCDCVYESRINGLKAAGVMYRLIFGGNPPNEFTSPGSDSFRRHLHWNGKDPANVTVSDQEDTTQLTIQVASNLSEPASWEDSLDTCHMQASLLFTACVGES